MAVMPHGNVERALETALWGISRKREGDSPVGLFHHAIGSLCLDRWYRQSQPTGAEVHDYQPLYVPVRGKWSVKMGPCNLQVGRPSPIIRTTHIAYSWSEFRYHSWSIFGCHSQALCLSPCIRHFVWPESGRSWQFRVESVKYAVKRLLLSGGKPQRQVFLDPCAGGT
jgi:hypothetical protein